jgi:hypothetical protein
VQKDTKIYHNVGPQSNSQPKTFMAVWKKQQQSVAKIKPPFGIRPKKATPSLEL